MHVNSNDHPVGTSLNVKSSNGVTTKLLTAFVLGYRIRPPLPGDTPNTLRDQVNIYVFGQESHLFPAAGQTESKAGRWLPCHLVGVHSVNTLEPVVSPSHTAAVSLGDKLLFDPESVNEASNAIAKLARVIFSELKITNSEYLNRFKRWYSQFHPDAPDRDVLMSIAAQRKFLLDPHLLTIKMLTKILEGMGYSVLEVDVRGPRLSITLISTGGATAVFETSSELASKG